jgi:hypothetical protein
VSFVFAPLVRQERQDGIDTLPVAFRLPAKPRLPYQLGGVLLPLAVLNLFLKMRGRFLCVTAEKSIPGGVAVVSLALGWEFG